MTQALHLSGAAPAPDLCPLLSVHDLVVTARTPDGPVPLLHGISFDLHAGETLALAGESGSGKSITSLAIMGLLPPPSVTVTGGTITLDGTALTALPERLMRDVRGRRIAMIFQEPMTSLNPVMTVGTQLIEAIRAHTPLSRAAARRAALDALAAVRLSEPARRMTQFPHELSGGMRQRVMIAMALALKPDVLIADEPTTALDVTVQREVLDLLRDLQRAQGTAILLITHDMGVVAEMADRVVILRHGRIEETAPVRQIFAAPARPYTRELLAAVPRMGTGGALAPASTAPVVARLRDVTVRYDIRRGVLNRVTHRVHAVEGVSLDIRAGETLSLVGESGCGKSTVARAIVGLVPHTGSIEVAGHIVGPMTAAARRTLSRSVQIVFQDPMAALDPRMTVGAQIAEPLLIHGIGNAAARHARASDLMSRVGLDAAQLDNYPHEFSGGQRQRICIARALSLTPKLVIADESVSALDVSVQSRVLDLLRALKDEFGIAILFISHDMAVVENISDRVAVVHMGQIVEIGPRARVFGAPQHPYTRRLIAAVPVPDPNHPRTPAPRLTGEILSPVHPVGAIVPRHSLRQVAEGHLVAGDATSPSGGY